jgi:hypothetical protein
MAPEARVKVLYNFTILGGCPFFAFIPVVYGASSASPFALQIAQFLIGNHAPLMVISGVWSDKHIYFFQPPVAADSSYK